MSFGYGGDTDFFGNCGGKDGCLGTVVILIGFMFLAGYGITKGVKALKNKGNKPKTEQIVKTVDTPKNVIAYNNIKTR